MSHARRLYLLVFQFFALLCLTSWTSLALAQPMAPDLEVSDITFSPSPTVGVPTTARATLKNIGGIPSGPFNVQWVINGGQVGFDTISNLADGQTATVHVTHTFTPTGTFTIRYWADPSDALDELNEFNNLREETITPAVLKPDLSSSPITFSGTPRVGETITVSANISNIGSAVSPAIPIRWLKNGAVILSTTLAPLDKGFSTSSSWTWTPTSAGTATIIFEADAGNTIDELREDNNNQDRTATVQPAFQPDLFVTTVSVSPSPVVGEGTTVSFGVNNIGDAPTVPAISMRLLVDGAQVGTTSLPPLANGSGTGGSIPWTPSSSGTHTIRIEADYTGVIAEKNESNNSSETSVSVASPPRPDLTVTSISVSPAPVEGQGTTVSFGVNNIGDLPTVPSISMRLLVDGAQVGTTSLPPLGNGSGTGGNIPWTPSSSGTHTLRVEADYTGVIEEKNESNNSSETSVSVAAPPKPDVTVTSVSVSPAPVVGTGTTVSVGVNNIGDLPTVPAVSIRLLVDGAEVGSTSVPPLANGSGTGATIPWTPSLAGTHALRVEADYTGVIDEKNEANNAFELSQFVSGPDLTAAGIGFTTAPTVSAETTITATVSNLGGIESPAIPVQWLVDGTVIGSDTLAPLGNGASQTASFPWTPSTPGPKTVQLVVDPAGVIAETNEGNNVVSTSVDVADIPRADLRVTDIAFSEPPSVGASITLSATLQNGGLVDSGPFQIRWSVNSVEQLTGPQVSIAPGLWAPVDVTFEWTPELADEGPATVSLEVDILNTVDESDETNNRFDEPITVLEPQFPTIDVVVSTNALSKNTEGWYAQNPVHASATIRCPASMSVCDGLLRVGIGSSSGAGRFYIYDESRPPIGICSDSKLGADYSHIDVISTCVTTPGSFEILGGQTEVLTYELWVQPSAAATLEVSGTWGVASDSEAITVEAAEIQPMVFIHGILGAMPPVNFLIKEQFLADVLLDPFIGGYAPILANAQKMGYEWDKSLFAIAYDWRQSNRLSAGFLAEQMRVLIPRARAVDYVRDDAKADLIVHSMGGMVSRAYVQDQALNPTTGVAELYQDDVRKLVFVASPHRGFPFDYQTYEGMTWSAYTYDSPLMAGGEALGPALDALLWPTFAGKKYDPTPAELEAECEFIPLLDPGPVTRHLIPYHYIEAGFKGLIPGAYACGPEVLTRWGHHGSRGILSLKEMLPTDDFVPAYLTNLDGIPPGRAAFFPWTKDPNAFLNGLNADAGTLMARLGLNNIYAVYGDNAKTHMSYEVDPPPGGSTWTHGKVVDSGIWSPAEGDDLVPAWSASMDGLLPLSPSNKIMLSAAPPGDAPGGSGRHKQIIFHPHLQKQHMPMWFTGMPVPFETPHVVRLPTLPGLFALITACPIDMLVEVTIGGITHRVGYDPATGELINDVPGAIVTAAGFEPQIILIPASVDPGDVRVLASGYDTGDFHITVAKFNKGMSPVAWLHGSTTDGEVDEFVFENEPDADAVPVAVKDFYGMERGTTLTIPSPGVLTNDSDLNGATLVVELVDDVAEGVLELLADGSFTYTPPVDFLGTVEFTYKAVAGDKQSEVAVVSIGVILPNIAPLAGNDAFDTVVDTTLDVPAPGVLVNDTDANDDVLTAVIEATTTSGTLTLNPDGSFTYVPSAGYIGPDSFTYKANDRFYDSGVATVSLQVLPPNKPPVPADDVFRMELTEVLEVAAPGVMTNDSDPDGDALTVSLSTAPERGTLTLSPDGSFTYEGGAEFNGVDTFTYLLSDGQLSVEARVFIRPPADCEDLYGFDLETDEIVRIDPATGVSLGRTPLGVDVTSVAMAFDSSRRLWLVAETADQPSMLNLYRVELDRDPVRIRHKYAFDVTGFALAFDLSRLGTTMGPDGKTLFIISGSTLVKINTRDGELGFVPKSVDPLGLDSQTMGLPGRCQDLIAYDVRTGSLIRVSRLSGELEPIGPTSISDPISSLAGAPDGTLYGLSGQELYRFNLTTGEAVAAASLADSVDAIAVRGAYSKYMCLDQNFDRRTKLSRYVVKLDRAYHSNGRSHGDRCERHGKKNCSLCNSSGDHGKCGDKGFYRIKEDGRIWIETAELPVDGVYRIRVQYRSRHGERARLRGAVGEERFTLTTDRETWHYSEKVKVRLFAGVNRIRFKASEDIDIERVHIERDCPEGCQGPKQTRCLDTRLADDGLSKYVVAIDGRAGHLRWGGGCCGGKGHYWVKGGDSSGPGRILAELEIPEDGRYAVRFQYRVGDWRQNDESVRLSLGGRSFDFLDEDLSNTRKWTWSERIEVGLTAGVERIEFLSIGHDSVHIERIQLEKLCECGGLTGGDSDR